MKHLRRLVIASVTALTLGAALLAPTGCNKKSRPVAFTGQLDQIDGVLGFYSVRHPKLIGKDLDILMKEVPETALARMFLGQLTPYGYPEFSEIAADSNIGIVILDTAAADLVAKKPSIVVFAKLKEGGKIGALLAQQHIPSQKHGDWTLFSNSADTFAKVKAPDAIIARLGKPQTEEILAWGRLSPELLALIKSKLTPEIEKRLAGSTLSPAARKAALAYVDVAYGLLQQLHSAGGSFDLKNDGITLTYFTQFQPDSTFGAALRYKVGPTPATAQYVGGDALAAVLIRQNPQAATDAVNTMLDSIIAVDFPTVSKPLTEFKASIAPILAASDGGSAMTIDLSFPAGTSPAPLPAYFGVSSGKFTTAQIRSYYQGSLTTMNQFLSGALPRFQALATPGIPAPQSSYVHHENALTVEGVAFDSIVFTVAQNGKAVPQPTQYVGVVDGQLVSAGSEAALRKNLPALIAKKPLAHSVATASPLQGDEVAGAILNGSALVDTLVGAAKLNLTDDDTKAQIAGFKTDYAAAGPVKATVTAAQARATVTITLPYKFISTSIHFGQFISGPLNTAFGGGGPAAADDSATATPAAVAAPAAP